jgi:hypothetical protein
VKAVQVKSKSSSRKSPATNMNIYLINQMFQPAPFVAEVWGGSAISATK